MWTVKKSPIEGEGVFLTKDIKRGTCLGLTHVFDDQILTGITELGKKHNHSKSPTVHSVKLGNKRFIFAIRELKSGDEITVDYTRQPELEQPKPEWNDE